MMKTYIDKKTLKAYQEFKNVLFKTYSNIAPHIICGLYNDLIDVLEDISISIADVIPIVEEFEENEGIGSDESNALTILDELIYVMENNKTNVLRLYELITDNFEDYSAIRKLCTYNSEHLSDTQIQALIPIAEQYGIHWIPEDKAWNL